MSDADDGFDREAERRKLEEKYGDDDQRRASTQRMSDLLLKGATMTNSHCDTCGDPIFRQNGQEFCPTCSANAAGNGAEAADEEPATADDGGESGGQQAASGGSERQQAAGGTSERQQTAGSADARAGGGQSTPPSGVSGGAAPPERSAETAQSGQPAESAAGGARSQAGGAARQTGGGSTRPGHGGVDTAATGGVGAETPGNAGTAGGGDLAAARAALTEAVRTHAARGTEATDPRTAADHFAAAREAAEALSALRR